MTIQNTITKPKYDPSLFTSDEVKIEIAKLSKEHETMLAKYQKQIDAAETKGETWKLADINANIDRLNGAHQAALARWNEKLEKALANENLAPNHPYDELSFDGRHKEIAKKEWIRNGGTPEDFEANWVQLKNKLLIELTAASMRKNIQPEQQTIKKL